MLRDTPVVGRMAKDTKSLMMNHLDSYTQQKPVAKNNPAIAAGCWYLLKAIRHYKQKT